MTDTHDRIITKLKKENEELKPYKEAHEKLRKENLALSLELLEYKKLSKKQKKECPFKFASNFGNNLCRKDKCMMWVQEKPYHGWCTMAEAFMNVGSSQLEHGSGTE